MKLKEVTRFEGFYTILTKERGFAVQRTINLGLVTRIFMGELMEDKGYFSKARLCELISVSMLSL